MKMNIAIKMSYFMRLTMSIHPLACANRPTLFISLLQSKQSFLTTHVKYGKLG